MSAPALTEGAVRNGGRRLFGSRRFAIRATRWWRWRTVGEKLLRGKLAIGVFVEFEQRFRCGLEFLRRRACRPCRCRARRSGAAAGGVRAAGLPFGPVFPFRARRWRRTQFVAGDLAVAVLVERGEGGGCAFDLLGGDGRRHGPCRRSRGSTVAVAGGGLFLPGVPARPRCRPAGRG